MSRSTLVTARNDGELIGGDLEVAIVQVHPIVVVRIVGEVVGGTDSLLKSVFETAMAVDAPSVEVDLACARFFDSHGLAALEEACSAVLCRGRSLVLRGLGRGAGSDHPAVPASRATSAPAGLRPVWASSPASPAETGGSRIASGPLATEVIA